MHDFILSRELKKTILAQGDGVRCVFGPVRILEVLTTLSRVKHALHCTALHCLK